MTLFAACVVRKSIKARPASGWLALAGIAAVKSVTPCNSAGNGPTTSMPDTASEATDAGDGTDADDDEARAKLPLSA